MSASKDTPKLAYHGLNTLSKLIESDTDVSTVDLNLLENLNTNQSLNYIKLEQNLNSLEKNANTLKLTNEKYQAYLKVVEDIESQTQHLEALVDELDQWSKEIQSRST